MILNFACAAGVLVGLCNADKEWSNYLLAFMAGGILLGGVLT
jgi:uncharacterized membrane protein YkvI